MRTRILSTATLLTVLLAGCVTQPVAPTPAAIAAEVKPGDRIRLVTRGGSEGEYRVVRVDPKALYVQPRGRECRRTPSSRSPTATSASDGYPAKQEGDRDGAGSRRVSLPEPCSAPRWKLPPPGRSVAERLRDQSTRSAARSSRTRNITASPASNRMMPF